MTARVRLVALAALAVVAGLLVVLATRSPSATRATSTPLLGRPAPDIAGTDVRSGKPFRLAGQVGSFVVVNFFASTCVPCVQEHPELVRFAQDHADGGAGIVSVLYDQSAAPAKAFFAEEGGTWPVIADPDGRVALDYGVTGIPETYVIDPDGVVVAKFTGATTAKRLDAALRRARS